MHKALVAGSIISLLACPASAQEWQMKPVVGDSFTFHIKIDNGPYNKREYDVTKEYTGTNGSGNHIFKLSTGGDETRNAFGARVTTDKYKHEKGGKPSHDGTLWPNLTVGSQWEHRVDMYHLAGGHYETRSLSCSVKGEEDKQTAVGTFKTRYVYCVNQKEGVRYPRYEHRWIDVKTGYIIHEEWNWEGSNPGRIIGDLVSMKLMPRQ